MKYSTIPIAVVLLLLTAPNLEAQVGQLEGTVKDTAGEPVEGAEVSIRSENTSRKYNLKTNKKGKYYHGAVSLQATYTVVARKPGYRTEYESGVRASFGIDDGGFDPRGGGKRGTVDFTLKEGKSGRLAFEMSKEERQQFMQQQTVVKEVRAAYNRGIMAFNLGQFEEAVVAFRECVAKDPKRPSIWANLGNAYLKLKQHNDAIGAYDKAIEMAPSNANFYQNLGNIYANMGNSSKAEESFKKSAELNAAIDPAAAAINYYNMGVTFINKGQNKQAEEALKNAVASDPTHAEAHYQLGIVLLGMNKLDGAITHLSEYAKLNPDGENAPVARDLVKQLKGGQ
jgi:tetratricopeptide (TPR) repeat protein